MRTYKCHQVPCHQFKKLGGLQIIVKWGHASTNVGLHHKVFIHYGKLNVNYRNRGKYGREKMTCHL
jgi:hypothetical protein